MPASLVIAATPVFEELQIADAKVWVLLSLYVPVAINCWVCKVEIDGFAGVRAIETRLEGICVAGW